MRRAALLFIAITFGPGCLSPHHTVRREELERLANAPRESRTELRAKQRIVLSAPPEGLSPERMMVDAAAAAEGVEMAASAVGAARSAASGADSVAQLVQGDNKKGEEEKTEEKTEKEKNDEKKDDSVALVVLAVVVGGVFIGGALAVSEGQRFDGQLALSPEQPIHLRGPSGEIGWVRARNLTPARLSGVTAAIVSEEDGPLLRLSRAPLDRRGFAYGIELGAGGMNTIARDLRVGFAGRMAVGFFPTQALGALIGCNLQTGPKGDQATAIDVRPHLELQLFPLRGGGWHGGIYGEAGRSFGSERLVSGQERSSSSWSAGGGLLVQRELTTLLALVLRGGVVALPDPGPAALWSPQVTIGIAVY